ncbi:hypothetical protein ACNSTQ_22875 [Alkalihalobacterium sp. APHAB7]
MKEHKGTQQAVPVGFRERQRGSTLFFLYRLHPYVFFVHPVSIRMVFDLHPDRDPGRYDRLM